ncbi:bacteriophytochrome (light-regulated signal transduction histidine kinase) [Candidatus Methanoperedens nitroreducens]|uniref:histidine kinase n=1 Tax=Candidatus Methanoperedens nitratireducens TaxID=1392998 RepID=A0A062V4E1_9EURY|nr:response regulator [Candidatus Methanoperedens nitroreducens]KCZ71443.1 bacteriophytochrome (light-regulated signal transduction histidine kinase) [Candidatus Methanoperedens nitroreducens]MDJ1421071.1 response regulator [Candidatus Methanoperedens sp.]
MGTQLRVLIVEDSENDALLVVRELRRGGYDPVFERVDTAEAMREALEKKTWDVIIADYIMPHFSGLEALRVLQRGGLDLPFIIISGRIGEDIAVDAMRAGAHDYIIKGNLTRLIPAIEREMHEAEVRRERKRALEELRESEARYRNLVDELEMRVEERTAELAQRTEDLARSNAELEQFAYVASHDLQEPLRMISGFTQILARRYKGKLDKSADEYIAYIVDGAARMQRMIEDLLAYSRVGTQGKSFEHINLEAVFDQAVTNLRVAIEKNGGAMTHDFLPTVMADDSQMVQLFQNLISNGIKFRGEEVQHVHISARIKENGIYSGFFRFV